MTSPFVSSAAAGLIAPESIGPILVEPLQMTSVALRVSSNVSTPSRDYRIPKILTDPLTHWVSEGAALTEENPTVDELVVTPSKLTAYVQLSRELVADSIHNEAATAVVGDGIVRSIARQIDSAYFGSTVTNGPNGLQSLSGIQTVTPETGTYQNMDWAIAAESKLNRIGSTATAFAMNANTLEALASLKRFEPTSSVVSNETILQVGDPTSRTKYQVNGTPLYWVPPVTPGTEVIADGVIWAIHDQRAFVVMRQDVELVTSPWPGFQNDLVTVRAIMRFGFGWPYEKAVVKISGTLPTIPGS